MSVRNIICPHESSRSISYHIALRTLKEVGDLADVPAHPSADGAEADSNNKEVTFAESTPLAEPLAAIRRPRMVVGVHFTVNDLISRKSDPSHHPESHHFRLPLCNDGLDLMTCSRSLLWSWPPFGRSCSRDVSRQYLLQESRSP